LQPLSDADARAFVRAAALSGKAATLSTKGPEPKQLDWWVLGPDNTLYRNHSYTITGLSADGSNVQLRNPWGRDHAEVPLTDIRKYFTILDMEQ